MYILSSQPLPMMGGSNPEGAHQSGSDHTGYGSNGGAGVQIPNFEPEYRSYDVSQDLSSQGGSNPPTSGSGNSYPYVSSNTYDNSNPSRQPVYTSGGGTSYTNYYPDNTGGGTTIYRGGGGSSSSNTYYPSGSGSVVYPVNRGRATAPNTGAISNDPVMFPILMTYCKTAIYMH